MEDDKKNFKMTDNMYYPKMQDKESESAIKVLYGCLFSLFLIGGLICFFIKYNFF